MKFRTFGQMGWNVSEVGLGTWQLGDCWSTVTPEDAREILKTAVDGGVNFFDTADVYGQGRSETIIGNFLKEYSEKIYVATKLGRLKGYPDGYSFDLFKRCMENSLRRLQVETLDLVQLHCIPEHYLISGEVFDWLRTLKQEGKIQAFGASVETITEAFHCLKQPDCASLQIIYNLFRQKPADTLFKAAIENSTALIIRLPLASGLLSGKMSADTTFDAADHRSFNRNGEAFSIGETFSGLEFTEGLALVEKVRPLLPDGILLAQAALRWILDYKEVSVIIPGATKVAQVNSNVCVSNMAPLDNAVHTTLRKLYDQEVDGKIHGRR